MVLGDGKMSKKKSKKKSKRRRGSGGILGIMDTMKLAQEGKSMFSERKMHIVTYEESKKKKRRL